METLKDNEVALLCIQNLNRYLEGEIGKEEWENNLRRIKEMMDRQQAFPFLGDRRGGPHSI
ncbi:MAG: hypothetical protein ACE5IM_07810, partial [Nitrospinota bacterium]